MKRNIAVIALVFSIILTSTSLVFSATDNQEIPNEVLTKYEKCHFKVHENPNHYHIYYPKYDGEIGIYHVGLKKELIWIWSKDYGEEVLDIKCKYFGKIRAKLKFT